MRKRFLVATMVAVVAGVAMPTTALAHHPESDCNTKALFTDTPLEPTLSPLFPEQTGTHEDGPVTEVVHEYGEIVEYRLDPGYRAVHYVNCTVAANSDL